MGNIPPSTSDTEFIFGTTTEQIDGVVTLRKQSKPKKKANKWQRGAFLPSSLSQSRNRRVKSLLMRLILEKDWQKVLIRARLFPREIHEFSVVEVPLPMFDGKKSSKHNNKNRKKKYKSTAVSHCRVKVLPIHVACALRPPPEVVRALLSHAVSSAFSSDEMSSRFYKTKFHSNPMRPRPHSTPIPLHHEHNTSFAAVAVECIETTTVASAIAKNIARIGGVVRKTSIRNKLFNGNKNNVGDENDTIRHRADCRSDNQEDSEHTRDVALFLKQMEDHLAHNGQRQSIFRDISPKKRMVDFDPSLPSPSAVRAMEKRTPKLTLTKLDDDLFSLENSIGDSDTSAHRLIGNDTKVCSKDSEMSSNLEFVVDGLSLCSSESSLLEPPESDSDDYSENSRSFLQLTVDGRLTFTDLEINLNNAEESKIDSYGVNRAYALLNCSEGSGRTTSGPTRTHLKPLGCVSALETLDLSLDPSTLARSLLRNINDKGVRGKIKDENKQSLSTTQGSSRLLPLHIACLYGASAAVLKTLCHEYPEASSIEVLGMLPIHMVSANWSLEIHQRKNDKFEANYLGEEFDSEKNRIEALVMCSPSSLWANSSAHGLRALEYVRMFLCHPSNTANESMIRAKKYLDSQEESAYRFNSHEPVKQSATDYDVYDNHHIEATSTCTTSGLSSYLLANDSSSVHSAQATNSPSPGIF